MKVREINAGMVTIDFYERDALNLARALDIALNDFGSGHSAEYDRLEHLQTLLEVAGMVAYLQANTVCRTVPAMSKALAAAKVEHERDYMEVAD